MFDDDMALQFFDPDHSDEEDLFILLGRSLTTRVLVVCHCFRESEMVIRIISARRADKDWVFAPQSPTAIASRWSLARTMIHAMAGI